MKIRKVGIRMLEISNVSLSYDIYNFKNSKIPISYSMGYSLS
ncbi:MAG: hypothetical protein RSD36_03310 [Terrisporobacter sp.]